MALENHPARERSTLARSATSRATCLVHHPQGSFAHRLGGPNRVFSQFSYSVISSSRLLGFKHN